MRKQKRQWLMVVALLGLLFLAPPVANSDSRMMSLADPAFTHSDRGVDFMEEDGVPFLPNTREILIFPHSIVSDELFSSHTVYLDFYNADIEGTGAVVLRFSRFAFGLLHSRDNQNSWVIGSVMDNIDSSLSASFYDQAVADVGIATPRPPVPPNIVDIFGGINIGPISIGLSAGGAVAHDDGTYGFGGFTPDELRAGAAILTLRAGAGVDLDAPIPLQIDAGFTVAKGYADSKDYGVRDYLEANNNPITGSLRVICGVFPTLDLVLVGGYSRLTQEFEVVDNDVPIDQTGAHVTDFVIQSFGGGLGALWTPMQKVLIVGNVSVAYGNAEYTSEINGPEDRWDCLKVDAVLGTEYELVADRFWIRGGIGQTSFLITSELTSNIGLPESSSSWLNATRRAAAGIGFKLADSVLIDFTLNLDALASDAPLSSPSVYTSLTWSM